MGRDTLLRLFRAHADALVGGLAVNLHGVIRATEVVDPSDPSLLDRMRRRGAALKTSDAVDGVRTDGGGERS